MNLSGVEYVAGRQWPTQYAPAYYLGEKHMNVLRLPILWELVQPTLGGGLDAAFVAGVQQQIDRVRAQGGKLILDLHNFGRRQVGGVLTVVGAGSTLTQAHLADVWSRLGTTFGGDDMIYEIMNEPHDQDGPTLVTSTNAAIAAIRAVGRTNLILVDLLGYSGRYAWAGPGNFALAAQIMDPASNWAIDYHAYLDPGSAGSADPAQAAMIESNVLPQVGAFTVAARAAGLRVFLGEFASAADAASITMVQSVLDIVETNRDVWIGWAWWCGGGYISHGYPYLLDPYSSPYDTANPQRTEALTWAAPRTDKPQMGALRRYLEAG